MSADSGFTSWFLSSGDKAKSLAAAPLSPGARDSDAFPSPLSAARSLDAAAAGSLALAGSPHALATLRTPARARPKSSSELMLDDAVRWVLWQHSRRALAVADADDLAHLRSADAMQLAARQWLVQFVAGHRLPLTQATQLWAKHDAAARGWINASM